MPDNCYVVQLWGYLEYWGIYAIIDWQKYVLLFGNNDLVTLFSQRQCHPHYKQMVHCVRSGAAQKAPTDLCAAISLSPSGRACRRRRRRRCLRDKPPDLPTIEWQRERGRGGGQCV